MRILSTIAAVGLVLGLATAASAGEISYTDTINLARTNWADCVTIQKFNGPGTLVSVKFELVGHVEGSAAFESKDSEPATILMDLQALLKLTKPDATMIVDVLPLAHTSDLVTAYDNNPDFGGTSGKTYSSLSGDESDCSTLTAPADLALFIGSGSIDLPVVAEGTSGGSGAGNLLLQFSTSASAEVKVTYTYNEVPEPATLTLLGTGLLGGLGLLRRRFIR